MRMLVKPLNEARYQARVKQNLVRKAKRLGYSLVAIETGEVVSGVT